MSGLDHVVRQFAAGCFMFVDRSSIDEKYDFGTYRAKIVSFLESIENITKIDVGEFSSYTHLDPEGFYLEDEKRSNETIICPMSGSVSFEIYIPKRAQEKVFYRPSKVPAERFSVFIRYGSGLPVTFVESRENVDISYGFTDFVAIIREYIISKTLPSSDIEFLCLGPSPFHADFFLKMADEEDSGDVGQIKISKRMGYDDIYFIASSDEDIDTQYDAFKYLAFSNLSIFYDNIHVRNQLMTLEMVASNEIHAALSRLLEPNIAKRFWSNLIKSNQQSLLSSYQAILEIEYLYESANKSFRDSKAALQGEGLGCPILDYSQYEIDHMPKDLGRKLSSTSKLIEVFEVSRANNFSVFTAALLSAIIAAGATIAAQGLIDAPRKANATSSAHATVGNAKAAQNPRQGDR